MGAKAPPSETWPPFVTSSPTLTRSRSIVYEAGRSAAGPDGARVGGASRYAKLTNLGAEPVAPVNQVNGWPTSRVNLSTYESATSKIVHILIEGKLENNLHEW